MQHEEWRIIPGWEAYEASDSGKVRRLSTGKILSPCHDKDGYLRLNLSCNGVRKSNRVHKLVLLAFVGPYPDGKPEIAHRDGDKEHNNLSNLRYVTYEENCQDKHDQGIMPLGEKHVHAKVTDSLAMEIHQDHKNNKLGVMALSRKYGVHRCTVNDIIHLNRRFKRLAEKPE
jgi:hypothetical protein